jgi:hypothetical protein
MEPERNGHAGAGRFDPFARARPAHTSKAWLWATAVQAALTCGLLLLARHAEGRAWHPQAQWILVLGIVATWSLALRTIRERLVELMHHWQKASRGLLRKASESGQHLVVTPRTVAQAHYIRGAIWRLRLIAAGLTIPFFVMPLVCSFLAVFLALQPGASPSWAPLALLTLLGAFIVAGYFHWAILPLPVPVKVNGYERRFVPPRRPGAGNAQRRSQGRQ